MVENSLEEIDPAYAPDPTEPKNAIEHFLQSPIETISSERVVSAERDATLEEVIQCMNDNKIGAVAIVDGEKLVGIFTERDVLTKIVGRQFILRDHKVGNYMTPHPECLNASQQVAFALNKMVVGGYRHVPIIDSDGRPMGIVSMREIMDHLVDHFPDPILNLPPEPDLAFRGRDGG